MHSLLVGNIWLESTWVCHVRCLLIMGILKERCLGFLIPNTGYELPFKHIFGLRLGVELVERRKGVPWCDLTCVQVGLGLV